jgi:hypothetical protein
MPDDLSPTQRDLTEYMSDISELAYAAAWMLNLEHSLWRAVVDGPYGFGQLQLEESHILKLCDLAAACGGWIRFDEKNGEVFVPMAQWEVLYNRALVRE